MSAVIPTSSKSNPVPVSTKSRLHGVGSSKPNHPEKCPMWLHVVAFAVIFGPFLFN